MTWLARLEVEAERIYAERLVDNYAWHKRIWQDCFASAPDAKRDFLSRIDRNDRGCWVWILAEREPIQPHWCTPENFGIKTINDSFFSHRFYAFDLVANPTKCIDPRGPDGQKILRRNGKRTKGKRIPIVNPDELRNWLVRKSEVRCRDEELAVDVASGFRIVESRPLEISPMVENHFRKQEHAAYHGGVRFRGILEVINREQFVETYHRGIGSAKGFGFGLLLLAPVNLPLISNNQ